MSVMPFKATLVWHSLTRLVPCDSFLTFDSLLEYLGTFVKPNIRNVPSSSSVRRMETNCRFNSVGVFSSDDSFFSSTFVTAYASFAGSFEVALA